jgi:hypothetical protein
VPFVDVAPVANHIFAADDVVLRIATDHPEARPDARWLSTDNRGEPSSLVSAHTRS